MKKQVQEIHDKALQEYKLIKIAQLINKKEKLKYDLEKSLQHVDTEIKKVEEATFIEDSSNTFASTLTMDNIFKNVLTSSGWVSN